MALVEGPHVSLTEMPLHERDVALLDEGGRMGQRRAIPLSRPPRERGADAPVVTDDVLQSDDPDDPLR
jgi:hypothetical protein